MSQDLADRPREKLEAAVAAAVAALATGHGTVDFYMNLLPSILPFLALTRHFSLTALGALVTVMSVTSSFLQPWFGVIIDRHGHGWLLAGSMLWAAVLMTAIAGARNFFVLMVLSTLAALGASFYHPIGSTFTTSVAPRSKGPAMSLYVMGGAVGAALAPLMAVPLVEHFGQHGLWFVLIPGLVAVAFVWQTLGRRRVEVPAPRAAKRTLSLNGRGGWLLLLNVVVGLRIWALAVVNAFIPLLFVRSGYSQTAAGGLFTAFLVAGAVGVLIGGYLADRLSRRTFFIGSMGLTLISFTMLVYTSGPWSWLMLVLTGAVVQAPIPLTVLMAQELLPAQGGMASGTIMGLSVGLGYVGSLVTGLLGDRIGLLPAVRAVIPLLVLGTILSLFYAPPVAAREGHNSEVEPSSAASA